MTINDQEKTYLITLLVILAVLAAAFLLWSEVGLKRLLPTGEVWSAYYTVSLEPDQVLFPANWPNRPLRWVPHWIPYQLDTDSFLGYNIYIVVLFVLRGTGVYLLLQQLFKRNAFIPIAAMALYMVYPAGTGWFSFRALTNQTATVIGIYALWLLVLYWNQPRRWLWPLIWAVQVISLLTYEQMYGVFAVAPALFWWIERRVTLRDWRFWRVTGLWYLTLLPTAAYFYSAIQSDQTIGYIDRQMGVLENDNLWDMIVDNMLVMYQEHFNAWSEQFAEIEFMSRHLTVGLLVGLVFAALSWFIMRRRGAAIPFKQAALLLVSGFLFMAVSFAHYSFISDQSPERLRVYFVTTLGAAFLIAVVLDQLRRIIPDVVVAALLVIFVAIGAVDVQQQLRFHGEEGMEIQRLAAAIVEQLHDVDDETTILVIDDGNRFTDPLQYARSHHLQNTLLSIYDKRPKAYMCSMTRNRDKCVFTEDEIELWRVRRRGDIFTPIPYDNLLIFRTLPGKEVELVTEIPAAYYDSPEAINYNPQSATRTDMPLSENIKAWFACWELENCEW